jgi:integrase
MAWVKAREWSTADGKPRKGYQVHWRDETGASRRKLFTGDRARQQANDFKIDIELAKRAGKSTAPTPPRAETIATIRQAGERWVRHVESEGRERSTWKAYERQLKQHIYPTLIERPGGIELAFGDLDIEDATAPDCEALKNALVRQLKPKYARRMLTVVKMVFNDCVRRGRPLHNPALAVKVKVVKRADRRVKIPSKDELHGIIAAARTIAPAAPTLAEAWTLTTLITGLRPSENRGAAIEDLVLEAKRPGIKVERRADQWNMIGPVKTETGRRFVPLAPEAVALLRRWLLTVPRGEGFKDPETGRTLHLLFPNSLGHVLPHSNLHNLVWVPVLAKAGLVEWRPSHDKHGRPKRGDDGKPLLIATPRYPVNMLRHLCASLKIEQGIDPKTLMQEMGHSSIQVTYDVYGHLFRERDGDGAIVAGIGRELLG